MAAGAAWMVAMRFGFRAIGFASTVILARLLVPEDFGIVAMAMMVVGLLEAMSMFGFHVFLIRKQDADRVYYDTAWSMSILRGLFVALLLLLMARFVSDLFGEPRVEQVMYVLALVAVVDGLENVGVVDFRKHFRFDRDFAYMLCPKVGSFVVTISLAVALRSYWALVMGIFFGSVLKVTLSFVMHPFRPKVSLRVWREIFTYSKWLLANSVMGYISNRGDSFFVAKFGSTQAVGLYAIAYEISNLALSELVVPIQRALLPGFARLADDREKLARNYADGLGLILLVALPVAAGIGVSADLFVPILLGDKWAGAIPLIQILTACGAVRVSWASSGAVYQAVGKPQIITVLLGMSMIVGLPALYFMSKEWGAIGAALAATLTALVFLVCNMVALVRYVSIPVMFIVAAVWRSVLSALLLVASVLIVRGSFEFGSYGARWMELLITVATGAISYAVSVVTLWWIAGRPRGGESLIFEEFRLRWARLLARRTKGRS